MRRRTLAAAFLALGLVGGAAAVAQRPKAPTNQALSDDRLAALERKIDLLLESMEGLRKEVGSIKSEVGGVSRDIRDLKRQGRR